MSNPMPEHPMDPFLRIVGETTCREVPVGACVPWRLATHVVAPRGMAQSLVRHVTIDDVSGRRLFTAPPLMVSPRGPDLERYDDQAAQIDVDYDPVIDVAALEPVPCTVRATLEAEDGTVVAEATLDVHAASPPRLKARIELAQPLPDDPFQRLYAGGIVRVGDVDGDGQLEIVHAVGARHIAVYRRDGSLLWRYDDPEGALVYNTAAFRVYDLDGDGRAEIIATRGPFGGLDLAVLEGSTGAVRHRVPFPAMQAIEAKAAPYIERLRRDPRDLEAWDGIADTGHAVRVAMDPTTGQSLDLYGGKIHIASFRGVGCRDLLVQAGDQNCTTLTALDQRLQVLWQHRVEDSYGGHNVALDDTDGDGFDEVAVGTRMLDHDGEVLWRKPFDQFAAPWEDDHIDQAHAGPFGPEGKRVVVYSCRVCVDAGTGETMWIHPTWHGQEAHVAPMVEREGYHAVFSEREYRHSGHLCHGTWFDCRDAAGRACWSYRHAALHMHRMLDWNGDGLYEASFGFDLQRRPVRPNLGIFDGRGRLIGVVPRYGFGADVDGDGFDELVAWTQWPDAAATIEIFGQDHGPEERGAAISAAENPFAYNEPD